MSSQGVKEDSSPKIVPRNRPWSLVSVFAPTVLSLAVLRWGATGLDKLGSLMNLSHDDDANASYSAGSVNSSHMSVDQLRAQYAMSCPPHQYRTNIFSTDPLIIYVEDYLSSVEVDYLLNLAMPLYRQSPVSKGHRLETYDTEIRSSMSAVLPRDPVVGCIEERSVEFQGFMPKYHLEGIQVVKYTIGDHFRPHFDVSQSSLNHDSRKMRSLVDSNASTSSVVFGDGKPATLDILRLPSL